MSETTPDPPEPRRVTAYAVFNGHHQISQLFLFRSDAEFARANRGDSADCTIVTGHFVYTPAQKGKR